MQQTIILVKYIFFFFLKSHPLEGLTKRINKKEGNRNSVHSFLFQLTTRFDRDYRRLMRQTEFLSHLSALALSIHNPTELMDLVGRREDVERIGITKNR